MAGLLVLSFRGALIFGVVWALDRGLMHRLRTRSRRAWWWLVAAAFLLPMGWIDLSPLPQPVRSLGHSVASTAMTDGWDGAATAVRATVPARIRPWLGWMWMIGAAGSLGVVVIRTVRTQRRWARERLCTDAALLNLLEDCKSTADVTAPIGLVLTEHVASPALLGWLRPRILLPARLVAGLPQDRLRGVLLHELAHFRAFDLGLHWAFSFVCAMHWFNPFAHLAVRQWLRFRELAADEATLMGLTPEARAHYGETLIATVKHAQTLPVPSGALALGESLTNLKQRIVMLTRYTNLSRRRVPALCASLALVGILLLQLVRGEDTPNDTAPAVAAMQTWLQEIDAGRYEQSWTDASEFFRKAVASEQWKQQLGQARRPLGRCDGRNLLSAAWQAEVPAGAKKIKGPVVIAQFSSAFENLRAARETVSFVRETDGSWKAAGYFIKPD